MSLGGGEAPKGGTGGAQQQIEKSRGIGRFAEQKKKKGLKDLFCADGWEHKLSWR